jgi:hypothetical protein
MSTVTRGMLIACISEPGDHPLRLMTEFTLLRGVARHVDNPAKPCIHIDPADGKSASAFNVSMLNQASIMTRMANCVKPAGSEKDFAIAPCQNVATKNTSTVEGLYIII